MKNNVLGRWMLRDPALYVDGLNTYEYARSRSIRSNDPFGLATCPAIYYTSDYDDQSGAMGMQVTADIFTKNGDCAASSFSASNCLFFGEVRFEVQPDDLNWVIFWHGTSSPGPGQSGGIGWAGGPDPGKPTYDNASEYSFPVIQFLACGDSHTIEVSATSAGGAITVSGELVLVCGICSGSRPGGNYRGPGDVVGPPELPGPPTGGDDDSGGPETGGGCGGGPCRKVGNAYVLKPEFGPEK